MSVKNGMRLVHPGEMCEELETLGLSANEFDREWNLGNHLLRR